MKIYLKEEEDFYKKKIQFLKMQKNLIFRISGQAQHLYYDSCTYVTEGMEQLLDPEDQKLICEITYSRTDGDTIPMIL